MNLPTKRPWCDLYYYLPKYLHSKTIQLGRVWALRTARVWDLWTATQLDNGWAILLFVIVLERTEEMFVRCVLQDMYTYRIYYMSKS